jgi:5,10-methylenetetrahydromethanopterin reductase
VIFDISFVSSSGSPSEICHLAARAEKLGFRAAWMAHDLLSDNAWVICGAVANSTSRIEVGPGIVNPYSCSLPEIAMGAASLDNLSNGRCVLGIGPGAKRLLLDGNIRQVRAMSKLEESISYLRQALGPETEILKIRPTRSVPIYMGGQSPRLLENIGRWGVGALPLLTPPSYASKAFALMKKGADSAGIELKQEDLVASILVSLANDENEAARTFADFTASILQHLSPYQLIEVGITPKEVSEIVRRYLEEGWEALPSKIYELGAVGTENCIKALNEVARGGFTRAKIGSPLGPDKEMAMEMFVKSVQQHFSALMGSKPQEKKQILPTRCRTS